MHGGYIYSRWWAYISTVLSIYTHHAVHIYPPTLSIYTYHTLRAVQNSFEIKETGQ